MKRLLLLIVSGLLALPLSAQVIISGDMFRQRVFKAKVAVLDSLTAEPVGFASVYLKEKGDTVISNFTLTDAEGKAELSDITQGNYTFTVEFFGYKSFVKEVYFRKDEDFGTVRLQVDAQQLEAAKVSAIANPIEMRQDTVIYNAAAFKTLDNAMLKDLLKKMPGFEIGSDGTVKHNGEELKEITVGGKRFFLDDKSAALNNLPAKIVDQVKVIDRESEASQFSGIKDAEKEKVMDIELKKEYKQGFFGNLRLGAGTNIPAEKDKNLLNPDRKLLFNNNVMLSAYSEKDQLTVLGGATNAQGVDDGLVMIISYDDQDVDMDALRSLNTTFNAGANLNTDRITGMDGNGSVNFRRSLSESRTLSDRTTFQENAPDLLTRSSSSTNSSGNTFSTSFRFSKKDQKKYNLYLRPSFRYSVTDRTSDRTSETLNESGGGQNHSSSLTSSLSNNASGSLSGGFGIRNLGKERRSISISMTGSLGKNGSDTKETSETYLALLDQTTLRDLTYRSDGNRYNIGASLSYVEPLADRWALQTTLGSTWSGNRSDRDAFNPDGSANDYYSSLSDNLYRNYNGSVLFQYNHADGANRENIQFGAQAERTLNQTYTESFGVKKTTGEGDWYTDWAPFLRFSLNRKKYSVELSYHGRTSQPSQSRMLPVLDLSSPTQLSLGNIYLHPSFRHNFSVAVRRNDPAAQRSMSLYLTGGVSTRSVSTASWFDENSIRYSIPVQSRRPAFNSTLYLLMNTPLNSSKTLSVSINGSGSYMRSIGYQSINGFGALDTKAFDYMAFMSRFWGDDASGSLFYSGKSGFQESVTRILASSMSANFRWKPDDDWSFATYGSANMNYSRFSLDERANTLTRSYVFSETANYTTPHAWELETTLACRFYRGYAAGYGEPVVNWDFKLNKNIRQFGLSFLIRDILGQNRNNNHTATDNYVEDSYYLIMGRYFLVSFTWNFGKMNAAQSQRAQSAMWNLAF